MTKAAAIMRGYGVALVDRPEHDAADRYLPSNAETFFANAAQVLISA